MRSRSTDNIRRTFLDFFVARDHQEVDSGSLVPANDPTLLFTNAGMVPFKDVFTGKERRPYVRAASSQKCVRAGGKHNDLENVGYTTRHHTFFEMLGNFSFGDYFKRDAIAYAWELLTQIFELPVERLVVTVFRGEDGMAADDEAATLWREVGVSENRIFRLGKADNYWQMGDTGPQGPCSEIHYCVADDPGRVLSKHHVEASDGWTEIWNLVFMQFFREHPEEPLQNLPQPSVDTGMGLERISMVLQGKRSVFDIDSFAYLLNGIAQMASKRYEGGDSEDDVSMRVVADHARATAFLVADGVQPTNEGRGYVLRRIMRRAIRHGARLGFDDLFLSEVAAEVVLAMKAVYPELEQAAPLIRKVAESEEAAFRRTLDKGLRLLSQQIERTEDKKLEPDFVADLYDTYGFPIDLTRVIAEEQQIEVDEAAAQEAVRARQAGGAGADLSRTEAIDRRWFELAEAYGPTAFVGYETGDAQGNVRAIVGDGDPNGMLTEAKAGTKVRVILDRTPFYGESGGQVGDVGTLTWPEGRARIVDATKPLSDLIVHHGVVEAGTLRPETTVRAQVDTERRDETRRNHSATHLLHLALRETLGPHVQQKGSLVAPERLRFDYSHFEPLTAEQVSAIEARINRVILDNAPTVATIGSLDKAKAAGALMLFGEKYGETVRMVQIGKDSLELCGGTHVERTGDIGLFKILSDSGLSTGIRRLEAVTGMNALHWAQAQESLLRQAASALKASPESLPGRIQKLLDKTKQLERDLQAAQTAAALGRGGAEEVEKVGGLRILFKSADGTPRKALRPLADRLRDRLQSGLVVLHAEENGRVALLVAATKDLKGKVHAGKLVKEATSAMGGSGGGRPDMAEGGGPAQQLETGLARIRTLLRPSDRSSGS